jgi:hypothetical protein
LLFPLRLLLFRGHDGVNDIYRDRPRDASSREDPARITPPKAGFLVLPRDEGRKLMPGGMPLMLLFVGTVCLAIVIVWGVNPNSQPEAPGETPDAATLAGAANNEQLAQIAEEPGPTESSADPPEIEAPQLASGTTASSGVEADRASAAYLVQVGAFRNAENAERLRASLETQNLEVRISVLPTNLHAVDVGPFPDRSSATAAARQVADLTGLTPLVVGSP